MQMQGSTCTKALGRVCSWVRVGEAFEIARAYLFLLMQEGYGTGQTVVLDGGAALV